jgi:hypothetical protein
MLKVVCFILLLLGTAGNAAVAAEAPITRTIFRVLASDPATGATIATGDKLYLHLSYESPVPVRFQAEAIRQDVLQEKSFNSSTPPSAAGRGEAIVWFGFPHSVRIDEIIITAYDVDWQQIGYMNTPIVVTWSDHAAGEVRHLAPWVEPLLKNHRRVFDTTIDPQPTKPDPLFDVFFLFSVMSIPLYLILQTRMVLRYRGDWRRAAATPLITILPLCLYSFFGLGLETANWVIFLFYFFPVSLAFLCLIWGIRWVYDRRKKIADLAQQEVDP